MPENYDVQPLGGFDMAAKLEKVSGTLRTRQRQTEMLDAAQQVIKEGTPEDVAAYMVKFPEMSQTIQGAINAQNAATVKEQTDWAKGILIGGADPVKATEALVQEIDASGRDATESVDTLGEAIGDPAASKVRAEKVLALHDPAAYKSYKSTMAGPAGVKPTESMKHYALAKEQGYQGTFMEYQQSGTGNAGVTVGAQEILEDGTTIQSLKGGGTVVYNSEGQELKGADRTEAIQAGRAEKVSNLRKAAGGKRGAALEEEFKLKGKVEANVISAKEAAKASGAAFDKVEKIYQNIENLNEAVRLVEEEGADTGAIMDRLPSMRSAAVKLDNLQGRLGLDIIQNTTFGALSEAELKFALSTALPQRLDGPALVTWAKKKAASQEKLADYLESAAIYLGTPGNTKVGWLEKERNKVGDKYGRTQNPQAAPKAGIQFLGFEN